MCRSPSLGLKFRGNFLFVFTGKACKTETKVHFGQVECTVWIDGVGFLLLSLLVERHSYSNTPRFNLIRYYFPT